MGDKNAGADEASRARKDESARQARIRAGTSSINSIFDGGPTYTPVNATVGKPFDFRGGEYYNADGTRVTKTKLDSFDSYDVGKFYTKGPDRPGQFTDSFFKDRRDAYTGYATPQLEDQYGKAGKELTFSLARGNMLDSSVRGEKMSELQKLYDIQKQQVADKALSYETSSRNAVEDARQNLISMLNVTGDAEGAASSALARSEALSAPTEYSPLGQLFSDFTNTLGVQAAQERSYAAGGPKPAYSTSLFGNTGGRVVVRN